MSLAPLAFKLFCAARQNAVLDVLPTIVEYWGHLGWYQYRVPAAVAGAGLDGGLDDDNYDVLAYLARVVVGRRVGDGALDSHARL